MKRRLANWIMVVLSSLALGSPAFAQTKAPEFPQDPSQWIHGRPVTVESLKGKAVFLWYFEETCPTCRAKWPGLLDLAKKHAGEPILFIAVNSGTPRRDIEQYAQETNVTWPVLVDFSRDYEKRSGITPEISLQNIHQLKILSADGQLQNGNWSDFEGTVTRALAGAKWKVDPKEVPLPLRDAWQAIEFGSYAAAGPAVKKGLTALQPETKQAAEKLKAAVQAEIDARLKAAQAAEEKGSTWDAYDHYTAIALQFPGFELPPEVEAGKKKLAVDPKVKAGILAQRDVETAKKLLSTASSISQKKSVQILEKVVKDAPDTGAGREAQSLLTLINSK